MANNGYTFMELFTKLFLGYVKFAIPQSMLSSLLFCALISLAVWDILYGRKHGRRKSLTCFSLCYFALFHGYVIYQTFVFVTEMMSSQLEDHVASFRFDTSFSDMECRICPSETGNIPDVKVRFIGQDVHFNTLAYQKFTNQSSVIMWTFNGKPIKESWRKRINVDHETSFYSTFISLSIMLLEESDFGNYSCWILGSSSVGNISTKSVLRYYHIQDFQLKEHHYEKHDIQIPPMGILNVFGFTSFLFGDENEVSYKHLVNGKEGLHCNNKDMSYLLYLDRWINPNRYKIKWFCTFMKPDFVTITTVCPRTIGIHTFLALRRIYNSSSMQWVTVEVQLPVHLLITPKPSPFLSHFSSRSNDSEHVSTSMDILTDYVFLIHLIEIAFISIVVYIYKVHTSVMLKYILCPYINHLLDVFFKRYYRNSIVTEDTTPMYIYIACEETDAPWCGSVLSPVFESLGHETYIPLRDARGGQSQLGGIQECMSHCSRYVLVLNKKEQKASGMFEHEVEVILDRLVSGELLEGNILIIRIKHASFSTLEQVLRVKKLTCVELSIDISPTDPSLDCVRRWLFSSKASNLLQY